MHLALETCAEISFPVAEEKTMDPVKTIIFLGVELDTLRLEFWLPWDKLSLKALVDKWRRRKCCHQKEL